MRVLAISLFLAVIQCPFAGAVTFDSAFSSGMVIQRAKPLRLAGTGTPGHDVKVSIDSITKVATVAEDSSWSAEFPPLAAGGPHVLKAVDGGEETRVDDVLSGDVWLCSGQSNMQMNVREVTGGEESMATAAIHRDIRILTIPRGGAAKPKKEFDARWQSCSAETLREFSAVAWFFALHLKNDPALADVPLGIINCSFGGTAIEAWLPADLLPDIPKDQVSASMFGIPPGALFNGMIAPLTGLRIKGVTWYQGEANAGHPGVYATLLENLIARWREKWQQPDLPFFIVQLPSFDGKWDGFDFSWLREAQATACEATPDAWLAVTYDTTDGRDLHPVDKQEIGRRLALLARRETYGSKVVASGPAFRNAAVDGSRVRVTFDNADGLLTSDGKPPAGFAIAGADGDYRYARAAIDGTGVILENEAIPSPVTVRYSWGGMPTGNLVNHSGLPVAPFRTDQLAPDKISLQSLPVTRRIETPQYQLTTGPDGQIASLIIRGNQFLSNEPNGGTRIPDGWGQRNFPTTDLLGPRRLKTSDPTGSLEIACGDDSMEWILRNNRDGEIEFQIALSPSTKVEFSSGAAGISRDQVKLKIDGIDHADAGKAPKLVAKIPPHSTATLRLTIQL